MYRPFDVPRRTSFWPSSPKSATTTAVSMLPVRPIWIELTEGSVEVTSSAGGESEANRFVVEGGSKPGTNTEAQVLNRTAIMIPVRARRSPAFLIRFRFPLRESFYAKSPLTQCVVSGIPFTKPSFWLAYLHIAGFSRWKGTEPLKC